MRIRIERNSDTDDIYSLNTSVFGGKAEAGLDNVLRAGCSPIISLVAVDDDNVITGHIFFSPISLTGHSDLKIMGLAAMAVEPVLQRRGIGTALVKHGLQHCRSMGFGAVVVLGHPEYCRRFGFVPSARYDIRCEFNVPEETFMTKEISPSYLKDKPGTIVCNKAFKTV